MIDALIGVVYWLAAWGFGIALFVAVLFLVMEAVSFIVEAITGGWEL